MQLRPCQGNYIFYKPMCSDYLPAYLLQTHWYSFEVIILEENHRQDGDKAYADMFLQELKIKVGAIVMLIHNLDVSDCLTNGSHGDLVSIEKDSTNTPYRLMIKFDDDCQGAQRRQNYQRLGEKYQGCTPIDKILFQYSLSKKSSRGINSVSYCCLFCCHNTQISRRNNCQTKQMCS